MAKLQTDLELLQAKNTELERQLDKQKQEHTRVREASGQTRATLEGHAATIKQLQAELQQKQLQLERTESMLADATLGNGEYMC